MSIRTEMEVFEPAKGMPGMVFIYRAPHAAQVLTNERRDPRNVRVAVVKNGGLKWNERLPAHSRSITFRCIRWRWGG